MAFISGSLIIDAPASALNNSGESISAARTENTSAVKFIRAQDGGEYPYVSGQAVRYWHRDTLESRPDIEWHSSKVYRGDKVAYTDANPLLYWDDDLFGYMRAPASRDYKKTKQDEQTQGLTPLEEDEKGNPKAVTRAAPYRIGTLVSVGSVKMTQDFGTMTRQDGDPVPYEHLFYRAVLSTLFSVNLRTAGVFTYQRRSGFQNLDKVRRDLAAEMGLEHLEDEKSYRFPAAERARRVRSLMLGLGRLTGGAKQATHYTDVSPAVIVAAVVRGGNHPFNYLFSFNAGRDIRKIEFALDVFQQAVADVEKHNLLLSPVYVGWKPGFLPEERAKLETLNGENIQLSTPLQATADLAQFITDHPEVMDQ